MDYLVLMMERSTTLLKSNRTRIMCCKKYFKLINRTYHKDRKGLQRGYVNSCKMQGLLIEGLHK
jgi:hypothetical protein